LHVSGGALAIPAHGAVLGHLQDVSMDVSWTCHGRVMDVSWTCRGLAEATCARLRHD